MGSKIGKVLGSILPIAAAFIPGVGPLVSAGLGAGAGLLSGGGIGGALTGAAMGGLGNYVAGGGLNDTMLGRTVNSGSQALGLGNIFGSSQPSAGALGSTAGALLDNRGGNASSSGGGLSSYVIPALGAATSLYSNSQAQDQLKKSTDQANAALNPYLANGAAASDKLAGFTGTGGQAPTAAEILAASPGYQFAQQQGEQALARKNAAAGGAFSGAALKEAADFNNGLSTQAANDYYSKLAAQSGQGLSAANQYGGNTTAMGSAGANSTIQTGNTISQLLSGIGKRLVGYDANNKPIYA